MYKSDHNSGTYVLLLKLNHDAEITVGSLGTLSFESGYYLYTGSALQGPSARIRRHIQKQKKLRWHIDYLTTLDHCDVEKIAIVFSTHRLECSINRALTEGIPKAVIVEGFGSSDCRENCRGHLIHFPAKKSIEQALRLLRLKGALLFESDYYDNTTELYYTLRKR